jgi:predicted PurR-regulated permease PerM
LLFFPVLLRGWDEDLGLENASRRVGVITVILFAVALIYWVYTHIVMQVSHTGISFLESIIGYLPARHEAISPWTYVPRYESESSESYLVYSYAWAFPVAVSTALLLGYLTRVLTRRNKESSQIIGVTSAFLATTIVGASFLAYKVSESSQYLIPLGYFLAMISSTIALSRILERNLKASFAALILLALFIYTGTSSPSHANLEHPEFESAAMIHRHTRYIEASLVSKNARSAE